MRKIPFYLFAVLTVFTVASSCKKDKHESSSGTPQTEIPDEFVGKWIVGNFNPANFSDYDGTRDSAKVTTLAYTFQKDGTAEQFIYLYEEASDKQTLTYRKGTATFDATTSTIKFNPSQGQYRIFQNGSKTEGNIDASGLYPAYAPSYHNCSIQQDNNTTLLMCTDDYNENISFAKTNW